MAALTSMVLGGLALGSAYMQADAQGQQAKFQRNQADLNAKLLDEQGKDAIQRGDSAALEAGRKRKQLEGSQRAAFAANGVNSTTGSAADIIAESGMLSRQDELTIKNNAWREAWGYRVQANDSRSQGKFAELAGKNQSRDTLLAGGIQAFDYGTRSTGSGRRRY